MRDLFIPLLEKNRAQRWLERRQRTTTTRWQIKISTSSSFSRQKNNGGGGELRYCPLPEQSAVTVFITPRWHGLYQGSSANRDSQQYFIFPNSGVLTRSEGGVTQVSTALCSGGGGSLRDLLERLESGTSARKWSVLACTLSG